LLFINRWSKCVYQQQVFTGISFCVGPEGCVIVLLERTQSVSWQWVFYVCLDHCRFGFVNTKYRWL